MIIFGKKITPEAIRSRQETNNIYVVQDTGIHLSRSQSTTRCSNFSTMAQTYMRRRECSDSRSLRTPFPDPRTPMAPLPSSWRSAARTPARNTAYICVVTPTTVDTKYGGFVPSLRPSIHMASIHMGMMCLPSCMEDG